MAALRLGDPKLDIHFSLLQVVHTKRSPNGMCIYNLHYLN